MDAEDVSSRNGRKQF